MDAFKGFETNVAHNLWDILMLGSTDGICIQLAGASPK